MAKKKGSAVMVYSGEELKRLAGYRKRIRERPLIFTDDELRDLDKLLGRRLTLDEAPQLTKLDITWFILHSILALPYQVVKVARKIGVAIKKGNSCRTHKTKVEDDMPEPERIFSISGNNKGLMCPFRPILCQEGCCKECQIYLDWQKPEGSRLRPEERRSEDES